MAKIALFHRLAAKEYLSALRWYARRSPTAARRFRDAVDRVVERLETDPEQGTPFQDSFWWMRTRRFPYVLYYEIFDPGPVWVYAVAHSRRRPGYWRRRAEPQ